MKSYFIKQTKKYGQHFDFDFVYFVKNGFWVLLRQSISTLAGISLSVVFARMASQEIYGQYQFVLSIFSVVSILSIPGLNTAITRSVARGFDGDYQRVVRISFFWSFFGVPVLLIIGGYYYITGDHPLGIALMISAIFFPFFYAPNTWDSFLQGKSRFDIAAMYGSVQSIINAVVTIAVLFFSRDDFITIIIWYFISYTFFNGFYFLRSLRYVNNDKIDDETLSYGWFLTKITFLGIVAANIDMLLVGMLLGPSQLAIYSIISFVPQKLKDFSKPFIGVAIPKFVRSEGKFLEILWKKRGISIILVIVLSLVTFAYYEFVQPVNQLLFGSTYASYAHFSQYLVPMVFFSFLGNILGYYVLARKYNFAIILANPAYQVCKIFLAVVLIWFYGLWGAIISLNVSFVLLFIFNLSGIIFEEHRKRCSIGD